MEGGGSCWGEAEDGVAKGGGGAMRKSTEEKQHPLPQDSGWRARRQHRDPALGCPPGVWGGERDRRHLAVEGLVLELGWNCGL